MSAGANMGHGASTAMNAAAQPVKYPFVVSKVILDNIAFDAKFADRFYRIKGTITSVHGSTSKDIVQEILHKDITLKIFMDPAKLPSYGNYQGKGPILKPLELEGIHFVSTISGKPDGVMTGITLRDLDIAVSHKEKFGSGSKIHGTIKWINDYQNSPVGCLAEGMTVTVMSHLAVDKIQTEQRFSRIFLNCPRYASDPFVADELKTDFGQFTMSTPLTIEKITEMAAKSTYRTRAEEAELRALKEQNQNPASSPAP